MPARRVQLARLPHQLLLHEAGQQQVHVVAAQHEVIAHGQTVKAEAASALGDAEDGEVGGAAADIADQDHLTDRP